MALKHGVEGKLEDNENDREKLEKENDQQDSRTTIDHEVSLAELRNKQISQEKLLYQERNKEKILEEIFLLEEQQQKKYASSKMQNYSKKWSFLKKCRLC